MYFACADRMRRCFFGIFETSSRDSFQLGIFIFIDERQVGVRKMLGNFFFSHCKQNLCEVNFSIWCYKTSLCQVVRFSRTNRTKKITTHFKCSRNVCIRRGIFVHCDQGKYARFVFHVFPHFFKLFKSKCPCWGNTQDEVMELWHTCNLFIISYFIDFDNHWVARLSGMLCGFFGNAGRQPTVRIDKRAHPKYYPSPNNSMCTEFMFISLICI